MKWSLEELSSSCWEPLLWDVLNEQQAPPTGFSFQHNSCLEVETHTQRTAVMILPAVWYTWKLCYAHFPVSEHVCDQTKVLPKMSLSRNLLNSIVTSSCSILLACIWPCCCRNTHTKRERDRERKREYLPEAKPKHSWEKQLAFTSSNSAYIAAPTPCFF